jgi:Fe2+ transport system protein B
MNVHFALAGNPNSGKTTLFNLLTGTRQTTGNWPGVTVEKKVGVIRHGPDLYTGWICRASIPFRLFRWRKS